jgi:hypothetical protein
MKLNAFDQILSDCYKGLMQSSVGLSRIAFVCLLFTLLTARAETVSINPSADTSLSATSQDNNFGANNNVISGTGNNNLANRALLQFDIAANLPADATISTATLTLNVIATSGGPDSQFSIYRLFQAWGEGNKTSNQGQLATTGEATWKARFAPNTLWSAPGSMSPIDFSSAASGSQIISGVGAYQFGSTPSIVADLQSWLNNPSANFGWILISGAEGTARTSRRFASREDSLNAPTLTITYAVPEPSGLVLLLCGGITLAATIFFRQTRLLKRTDSL